MSTLSDKILYYINDTGCISDSELVQSVLAVDEETANEILDQVGGVKGLNHVEKLTRVEGIGLDDAARIRAAELLGRRMRATSLVGQNFTSSKTVYAHFAPRLDGSRQEEFWILCLNNRRKIVNEVLVMKGGWETCPIDPKVIFSEALNAGATSIILAHNTTVLLTTGKYNRSNK